MNDAAMKLFSELNSRHGQAKSYTNYVSALQELCATIGWILPKYEYFQEHFNNQRTPLHWAICSAGHYKFTGEGNTKRAAENEAAASAFKQIIMSSQQKTNEIRKQQQFDGKTVDFRRGMSTDNANNDMIELCDKLDRLNINETITTVARTKDERMVVWQNQKLYL